MRGLGRPRTRGTGEEVWLSAQRLGCGYGGPTPLPCEGDAWRGRE